MSNAKHQQAKNFANAVNLVKARIAEIGEKLRTAEGEEKAALQKELGDLMSSLGMTYDPESPIDDFFASTAPAGEESKAEGDNAGTTADTNTSTEDGEGWWVRFKNFCGTNRGYIVAGVVATIAAGAALYAFLRGRGTTDTSSMELPKSNQGFYHGSTEGSANGDTAVDGGFMSKLGEWLVNAGSAIKNGLVAAKDWVVGLFSKSGNGSTEATGADAAMPNAA